MDIYRKMNRAEVVSFDIFDTLVLRKIYNPEDVFDLVANISGIKDFSIQRKNAQKIAFIEMHQDGKKEITMLNIYDHLPYPKRLTATLRRLEENLEKDLSIPNPYMQEIYNYAVNANKKIIVSTDMYLDRKLIDDILINCGYTKHEKIYISSELQATKRDKGDLFQLVIEDMQVRPNKILHIGDSVRGDVKMASSKGLKIEYYKRNSLKRPKIRFSSHSVDTFLNALYTNRLNDPSKHTSWDNIGYTYGGILHHAFLKWLDCTTTTDGIDTILFVSRDGYLLDKSYNMYYNNISHQYIYGSRVAFSLSLINHQNYEHYLDFLTSGYHRLSLYEIFNRARLPLPDVTFFRESGFKGYSDIIDTEYKINQVRHLLVKMKNLICEKSRIQREYALKYFRKIVSGRKKIAFVDIGWEGSTQLVFEKILREIDPHIEVIGYYFALLDSPNVKQRSKLAKMKAFICEPGKNPDANNLFSGNRALIELLFTAPHESVSCYEKKENNIIPDYIHPKGTTNNFLEIASEINVGVANFLEDINLLKSRYDFAITDTDVLRPLERLIKYPFLEESELIGDLHNFDGWASTINKKEFFAYDPILKNILNKNYLNIWEGGINKRYEKKPILRILREIRNRFRLRRS